MPRRVDRYVLHHPLGIGGMAQVSLAQLIGDGGFSRIVAVKELLPQHACERAVVEALLDEARIAAHVRHPNVVAIHDVVGEPGHPLLVMDYVLGAPLSALCKASWERSRPIAVPVAAGIAVGMLEGLHAAHEATDAAGVSLAIVHRDVSPQNVLVGVDGVARLTDFGIAKALNRAQITTDHGAVKGKICYMPPEQFFAKSLDRRSDVWAAALVLWEMLQGERCFVDQTAALRFLGSDEPVPPLRGDAVPPALAAVVSRGLARDPDERYATAREMAIALEKVVEIAPARDVGRWVRRIARAKVSEEEAAIQVLVQHAAAAPPEPVTVTSNGSDPVLVAAARPGRAPARSLAGLAVATAVAGLLVYAAMSKPTTSPVLSAPSVAAVESASRASIAAPTSDAGASVTATAPSAQAPAPAARASSSVRPTTTPRRPPATARPLAGPHDGLELDSRK